MDEQSCDSPMSRQKMATEELVREKTDKNGIKWRKVYFGGGAHFQNWLAQAKELGDVQVEEVSPEGLECFEKSDEKLLRIWVKEGQ
jgi:hypothetical protein